MTKAEKKKYFRERKAERLACSKKQDRIADKLLRNLRYERVQDTNGQKRKKDDVLLQPRWNLGKTVVR